MANKIKAEFQDAGGNIYHLHTSADVVFLEDGSTLESKLETLVDSSDGDISATKISTVDTVSTGFPVPAAGESTKTFAGKVKKFFQDFVALKDTLLTLSKLVNNGQTTATGFALDARYGKTLYDLYAQLNSNLTAVSNNLGGKKTISGITKVTTDYNGYAYIQFGYEFANSYTNIIISNNMAVYVQYEVYGTTGFGVWVYDLSGAKLINAEIWITWLAHGTAK